MNQPQPTLRLANLFKANTELMDEVAPRLGALQFSMIRKWRRATAQQLISYMPPRFRSRKSIDQPNDAHGVLK